MPIFPLDAVRNATIDQAEEPLLEDVREDVARFPFKEEDVNGTAEDVLVAFDLARPRLNVILSLLRGMTGKQGADISTGLGFLPVLLRRHGIDIAATERDLPLAQFAVAHDIEVSQYRIGQSPAPFDPDTLDFLVLAEVLEHLKSPPERILHELVRLLRPGGTFILTTPNVARLSHLEALAAGENFLEPFPSDLPADADPTDYVEHVREYSVREVVDAVEASGLEIDRVLMTGWGDGGYHPLPNPYANEIMVVAARR